VEGGVHSFGGKEEKGGKRWLYPVPAVLTIVRRGREVGIREGENRARPQPLSNGGKKRGPEEKGVESASLPPSGKIKGEGRLRAFAFGFSFCQKEEGEMKSERIPKKKGGGEGEPHRASLHSSSMKQRKISSRAEEIKRKEKEPAPFLPEKKTKKKKEREIK